MTVESLEIRKEILGADHLDVAETLINLANVSPPPPQKTIRTKPLTKILRVHVSELLCWFSKTILELW